MSMRVLVLENKDEINLDSLMQGEIQNKQDIAIRENQSVCDKRQPSVFAVKCHIDND